MEILAFDIGGTHGRCCLARRDGNHEDVLRLQREPMDDGRRWLQRLLDAGKRMAHAPQDLQVLAVSFGGPVTGDGRIQSMHVPGWESIDLSAELKKVFNTP